MADVRVPWSVIEDAFGVDGTVTRPAPNDDPIEAPVVWAPPVTDDLPGTIELQRRNAIRIMGIGRERVAAVPLRTLIEAPAEDGGASRSWRVDGIVKIEDDHTRVVVVEVE